MHTLPYTVMVDCVIPGSPYQFLSRQRFPNPTNFGSCEASSDFVFFSQEKPFMKIKIYCFKLKVNKYIDNSLLHPEKGMSSFSMTRLNDFCNVCIVM